MGERAVFQRCSLKKKLSKKGLTFLGSAAIISLVRDARVVELADSLDSGSSVHYARAGSSPASRTIKKSLKACAFKDFFLVPSGVEINPQFYWGKKDSFSMRKTSYCGILVKVWRPHYQSNRRFYAD